MSKEIVQNKDELLVKAESALLEAMESNPQVQSDVFQAVMINRASEELRNRIEEVKKINTPENATYKRKGGKDKDGNPLYLTYPKLGYMERIMENHISPSFSWEMLVPPTMVNSQKNKQQDAFYCVMMLHISVLGFEIRSEPATGVTNMKNNINGIEMAAKGCVTDAKKKCLSYLGICHDIYEYGEDRSVDEADTDSIIERMKEKYYGKLPEGSRDNTIKEAKTYLLDSPSLQDLKLREIKIEKRIKELVEKNQRKS